MGIIYFLVFVGLCAVGLVWYALTTIKHRRDKPKRDPKAPHYVHKAGRHPLLHTHHGAPLHPAGGDIWSRRRQHAAEEERGKYSVTARKIQFDDELAEVHEAPLVSMTEIEYTPTELHKSSNQKR